MALSYEDDVDLQQEPKGRAVLLGDVPRTEAETVDAAMRLRDAQTSALWRAPGSPFGCK